MKEVPKPEMKERKLMPPSPDPATWEQLTKEIRDAKKNTVTQLPT